MNVIKLYECEVLYDPYRAGNHFRITDKTKYYVNADKIKYFKQFTQDYGKRPVPDVSMIYLDNGDYIVVHIDVEELANVLMGIENKDNSNKNKNIN